MLVVVVRVPVRVGVPVIPMIVTSPGVDVIRAVLVRVIGVLMAVGVRVIVAVRVAVGMAVHQLAVSMLMLVHVLMSVLVVVVVVVRGIVIVGHTRIVTSSAMIAQPYRRWPSGLARFSEPNRTCSCGRHGKRCSNDKRMALVVIPSHASS